MPTPATSGVHTRSLLRDDVHRSLQKAIVDGTFAPGERLRDPELEKWLGVSRTPIREALLRLERAGLVITRPGRATTVAPADGPRVVAAQQVAAAMHELAARLAVPVVGDEELDVMQAANAAFEVALSNLDVEAALAADDRFHGVLVGASANELIAEVLELTTPVLRRVERMRFGSLAGRASVRQHRQIVAAARSRDAAAAARLSHENWMTLSLAPQG